MRPAPSTAGAPPPSVAERLSVLRALYVPERRIEARARLAEERTLAKEPFERAVARRLSELRELSDLTRHLHRAKFPNRSRST